MIVVYVIIVTSIANLSLQNDKRELLITLLSSAVGYALHRPSL
jgi:FtsH-binding integral membrane protein